LLPSGKGRRIVKRNGMGRIVQSDVVNMKRSGV